MKHAYNITILSCKELQKAANTKMNTGFKSSTNTALFHMGATNCVGMEIKSEIN